MSELLMLKDTPVLSIEGYSCSILEFDLLPYMIRYKDVNYDDVAHNWKHTRALNVGRTNAKQILNALGISQRDTYKIARACHFASITDCYWIKDDTEEITWKDVSLFQSNYSKIISSIALTGLSPEKLTDNPKLHFTPPDTSLLGMSAKTVIKENGTIVLYKVGRKEAAASQILDILGFSHVKYEPVKLQEALDIANNKRVKELYDSGECIVKCNLITSEDISIFTWEDYMTYCERHDIDPFDILENYSSEYEQMQVADYILNNEDRHDANWGFYMDNNTGKITGLHHLMDHDHAFSEEKHILSQSQKERISLFDAAKRYSDHFLWQLQNLITSGKPEYLSDIEWEEVIFRTKKLTGVD